MRGLPTPKLLRRSIKLGSISSIGQTAQFYDFICVLNIKSKKNYFLIYKSRNRPSFAILTVILSFISCRTNLFWNNWLQKWNCKNEIQFKIKFKTKKFEKKKFKVWKCYKNLKKLLTHCYKFLFFIKRTNQKIIELVEQIDPMSLN